MTKNKTKLDAIGICSLQPPYPKLHITMMLTFREVLVNIFPQAVRQTFQISF